MEITRRHFLGRASAMSVGFAGLSTLMARTSSKSLAAMLDDPAAAGFGPLLKNSAGVIDLPKGFTAMVISRYGDEMDDGLLVPAKHDGMAAFPSSDPARCVLICNHEIELAHKFNGAFGENNNRLMRIKPEALYDIGAGKTPHLGGTTTIIFDTEQQRVIKRFLSLAGTIRNCAGGPTPWGSWLSCEESVLPIGASDIDGKFDKPHGYVFEVPSTLDRVLLDPKPIKAMGRFNHEAVAVDPVSGVVYLTEDRHEGLLYRYIPKVREKLHQGGVLQAMVVLGKKPATDGPAGCGACTRNWGAGENIRVGETMDVAWIDVNDIDSDKDDLRERGFAMGAARFARGEGMWYGNNGVYFACTNGGSKKLGQIFKYVPSPVEGTPAENEPGKRATLTLFIEPNDSTVVDNADNVTVAPWGDLIVCEDGGDEQFLLGVTPAGQVYKLARNAVNQSEFAGATFSPDGSTLFVNIQNPGMTLAIRGPWPKV
jgi:uncharacterized protein